MANEHLGKINFETKGSMLMGHFRAMANPCLIIVEQQELAQFSDLIKKIMLQMATEVWRIEQKYSRYLGDSILSQINNANGRRTRIDAETYQLLNVADILWQESNGMFDISSGVFRKIWTFDGQKNIPSQAEIDAVLKHVGWNRIKLDKNSLQLERGMQIDFGGIGKEYAADRCAALAPETLGKSVLVNLGGDVVAKGPRYNNINWDIGIESKLGRTVWKNVPLGGGAIATSGDVYKSVIHNGRCYSHIINALTGYPTLDAPSTISVAAPNCIEAGMLSTLAMLQGENAEGFLKEQGRPHWIQR